MGMRKGYGRLALSHQFRQAPGSYRDQPLLTGGGRESSVVAWLFTAQARVPGTVLEQDGVREGGRAVRYVRTQHRIRVQVPYYEEEKKKMSGPGGGFPEIYFIILLLQV